MIKVIAISDKESSTFSRLLLIVRDSHSNIVAIPDAFESTDATAFNNRRIYLGAAEGSELHDLIPLEANLDVLGGVSFSKGCYVGQELMALRDQSMQSEKVEATFTNIDDNAATSLREYLLTTPVPTDQNAVQRGVKIICTETSKPIGSIITTAPGIRAALAMIRLEHLSIHGTRNAHIGQYTTSDGKFNLVPYQPVWWERLDSSSGKIMMTSN
ncbi:unnamed protein product [Albugo candida]|uniref:Aminomethyltransferase folate-binding domain-containing protein n=1 Tax=Albugo candida TaxID=65357 RepID=A0A024FSY8_9STRA|nr:unnamed protein product [Albugo candida]|eukprot:CCI10066.1 unnamed protein product [Albugo candida]